MNTKVEIEVVAADPRAVSASRLYEAECAMHQARQTRDDAWIAAAAAKLHSAIGDYLATLSAGSCRGRARRPVL